MKIMAVPPIFVFYWAYRLYQEWYNGEKQSEW